MLVGKNQHRRNKLYVKQEPDDASDGSVKPPAQLTVEGKFTDVIDDGLVEYNISLVDVAVICHHQIVLRELQARSKVDIVHVGCHKVPKLSRDVDDLIRRYSNEFGTFSNFVLSNRKLVNEHRIRSVFISVLKCVHVVGFL